MGSLAGLKKKESVGAGFDSGALPVELPTIKLAGLDSNQQPPDYGCRRKLLHGLLIWVFWGRKKKESVRTDLDWL
jgi:hypothetical protein